MTAPLLDVEHLTVRFPGGRGRLPWRRQPGVAAVQDASLTVGAGETVGLVGESGSGKTTLGRAVLRFVQPSSGTIRLDGVDLAGIGRQTPVTYRKDVQMVFQDPVGSLNPAMLVGAIVGEPVRIHDGLTGPARSARVAELLDQVGLPAHHIGRFPYELSGGQRQRVAIARALATRPRLIVLDEPVSALDVSTQSQVINLLEQIQGDTGAAYLLIAHDLAVVRHSCRRVVVMYRSRVVETGPVEAICERPAHPYTALLLASIPDPDPDVQRVRRARRRELAGGVAGVGGPGVGSGCAFADRCPYVLDVCRRERPADTATLAGGTVACHLHTSGPRLAGRPLAEFGNPAGAHTDSLTTALTTTRRP
ncbi:MAG TPA: oligopeptide/dipeptide ABC transporter ATP-binding protein [Ilumatobacter sp.]|nr:oligopeptide/dipeptide ABC transporter ATP-binding protein [Ilumatobacter sp.]